MTPDDRPAASERAPVAEAADGAASVPPAERPVVPALAAAARAARPDADVSIADTVREQLGGIRGMVESSLPVLVFVVANMIFSLTPALWAAVGSAVLIAVFRLARRDSVRHAFNGLVAVGIAAFIASRTGRAQDFYLLNIARNAVGLLAFGVSAAIRRPLVGYAWAFVSVVPRDWRSSPRLLRTFTLLSLLWAATFGLRVVVQVWFYLAENADALGVVSIVLGWPLFGSALALTLWIGRRALRSADEAPADA